MKLAVPASSLSQQKLLRSASLIDPISIWARFHSSPHLQFLLPHETIFVSIDLPFASHDLSWAFAAASYTRSWWSNPQRRVPTDDDMDCPFAIGIYTTYNTITLQTVCRYQSVTKSSFFSRLNGSKWIKPWMVAPISPKKPPPPIVVFAPKKRSDTTFPIILPANYFRSKVYKQFFVSFEITVNRLIGSSTLSTPLLPPIF